MLKGEFASIEIDRKVESRNLYIFFGGISSGLGMPIFEFYNSSKVLDENKIFVRDFDQCWYQNGLLGVGNDLKTVVRAITNEIEKINPLKIFFVGNSMGGYAAILFSSLINLKHNKEKEVIAFAPQTFIHPLLRFKYKDFRWKKEIMNMYKQSFFKRKFWNLRPLLLTQKKINISIFVSMDDELDCIHSEYISDITGVSIYKFEFGGHAIVQVLKDQGVLKDIMIGNTKNLNIIEDKLCQER